MTTPPRLLINLPPTFFTTTAFQPEMQRLQASFQVRTTSHNTLDEILPDLRWAEAVLMWAWPALPADALASCPDLRMIAAINTNQTTVRSCYANQIAISEVRHCWSPAVAEMALGLILDGLRRISEHHMAMLTGTEEWVDAFPADIDPRERQLTGLPVGIIGFGRIGQRLAELLTPFQVQLRIHDPFISAAVAEKFNTRHTPVLELVESSDVVVLCAANNEGARSILGSKEIAALRKDAVLVNIGRSMLVDMPALVERLDRGDLIAMLDVFDQEPLEPDSVLRLLPNTYLTPHRAGGIHASVHRALNWLADDLESYFAGRPLQYAVTESMLSSLPE